MGMCVKQLSVMKKQCSLVCMLCVCLGVMIVDIGGFEICYFVQECGCCVYQWQCECGVCVFVELQVECEQWFCVEMFEYVLMVGFV